MDVKPLSIIINGNYDQIELAVIEQDAIFTHTESSKNASKNILIILDILLKSLNKKLRDCSFIGVNQGPGPYTTLRTIMATVNGLHFATQIPLIGINGLETFVIENHENHFAYTIGLLNAFANDVYYAVYSHQEGVISFGCISINQFLEILQNLPMSSQDRIKCIGNGVILYEKQLRNVPSKLFFPEKMPLYCSLNGLIKTAYKNWHERKYISEQLIPLYLKKSL